LINRLNNMYQDNRNRKPAIKTRGLFEITAIAFKTTPANLGMKSALDSQEPFGILMDLSLPQGNATIVAFISGDASFYTSTGGGVIGGIGHENVRNAARKFVTARSNTRTK